VRLFIAMELSPAVVAAIGGYRKQISRQSAARDVRWTAENLLHLTLRFVGEVEDARVADVCAAAELAAGLNRTFDAALEGAGCFPGGGRVRIVWAGMSAERDRLAKLAADVESAVVAAGVPPEPRVFSPHVTIGRVREDRSRGELRRAVQACQPAVTSQPVSRIVVMSSTLSRAGPTYTLVSSHELGGQAKDTG